MKDKEKQKQVWIFHHDATPPNLNGFTRPYDFGVNLMDNGYATTVFASSYLHLANKNLIKDDSKYIINTKSPIPFVFIKTPSSFKGDFYRIKNMVSYFKGLFGVSKKYLKTNKKPDVIIASSPHPLTMVAGIMIAKKLDVPCICEVRDFWPEVFFFGGKLRKSSLTGRILIAGEKWIYKKADAIVFLKEGDVTYITDNKWDKDQGGPIDLDKCYYINNGVDLENFKNNVVQYQLEDKDLDNDLFKVVYTGAIRPTNNVGNILDTAKLLLDHKNIQFLIYGSGNQVDDLNARIKNEGLDNVVIKGYIDKKYIPYILSKSSINLLHYSQSRYNWSRGNSSNKLFEYMASGKPIISTVKIGYSPLEKYDCGIELQHDTPQDLAKAIIKVSQFSESQFEQMSKNALIAASDFDYKKQTKKLIKVIKKVSDVWRENIW